MKKLLQKWLETERYKTSTQRRGDRVALLVLAGAILLAIVVLLSGCASTSTITAQAELPPTVAAPPAPAPSAPVQLENLGKKVKFRGPVTLQIGTGNVAPAPPAPVTPPMIERGLVVPWQLIIGVLVAVALVCTWLGAKLASKLRWLPFLGWLLYLLTISPAQAQRQLVISNSHAFDYSDSKRVERRSRKVRKQNQKARKRILHQREKQMNRELRFEATEHRRRLKILREVMAKK